MAKMTFNLNDSVLSADPNKSDKKFDQPKEPVKITEKVLYPSIPKQTEISFAFLKVDFELDMTKKDCDVKITHGLEVPFEGHYKAVSNKPMRFYKAKENGVDKQGNVYIKKDEIGMYFDKFKECVLFDLMTETKAEKKFRRSVELFMPVYVFSYTEIDMEIGEKKTTKVDDICMVAFNMMGLYDRSGGIGKTMIKNYDENDKKNKLLTHKWNYSTDGIEKDEALEDEELEIVQPMRTESFLEAHMNLEQVKKLLPVAYDVIIEAFDKNEYSFFKNGSAQPKSVTVSPVVKEEQVLEEVESDEIPF